MKLFHYFLMFVFGANALCAQVAEKHKEHARNSGICISETEQNYIEAQIAHNVDSLRKKGVLLSNNAQKSSSLVTSLQWPVTYVGTDCNYYNIGNYVDQDPTTGLLDYNCGQDTYDGHQGIDIDTWPYGWYKMDNNLVHVIAAADGVIISKLDGQFDRSCTMNNNLPNYVVIQHADGSRARYLHMKNGSITTLPIGSSVTTGTYLGIMGSSGSSTYPHLHFEIRDANNAIIEPFYKIGGCNNYNPQGVSWWQNQEPPIRPVISSILTGASPANDPFCPIVIDTLNAKSCFIPNETFYIDMRGNDGNNLPVIFTVKRPNGTPYIYDNYVAGTSDYEYWRWYYTLNIPSSRPDGIWTIEASIGESVCTKNFIFLNPSISGITSVCSGASTTLTASTGSMYVWSTGATSNSISVSSAGTYTVTVTSEGGCTATATQVVSVLNNPTATISGANSICNGANTTLTASGGGTYAWNTGATSSAISVSSAGTYTVTVTNANGCTATATQVVSVLNNPTATISGANSICNGANTTLTASGGGTYAWNTGATSSAISVSSAGTYTVTVTNANGCTATATRVVSVLNNPTATISGANSICNGANTTLTASGGGTYAWNTGATSSAISVSSAGTYTVTVTNANGCTATATQVVSVLNNPTATISGANSICNGANTTLTASGGGTYAWNTGATSSAISVSSAGTYTVTVTNANGCTATATQVVSVLNNPTATISGANSICNGANTTLTASGGGTYAWNTGATSSAISVSSAGTYTVTVTNANGCTASSLRIITNGLGTPTNLTTTNITATSATLSWSAVPTAANYTILGRKVGTTNWITVGPVTGTSKNIQSQISACKTYEWKVRANCSDGLTSGTFSNTVQFTTLGCESANKQNVSEWDNYQFFLSPNPTTAETTLHYFVEQPSRVCINVYDAAGKMILTQQLETDTKGEQQYQLDTATLPKGIYMVQLQTDHIAPQTAKLIVQ